MKDPKLAKTRSVNLQRLAESTAPKSKKELGTAKTPVVKEEKKSKVKK